MYLHSKLYIMLKREDSAGYMTNWAARLFAKRIERTLKPLGLAPAYMPVIFALADGSTLSQKELISRAAVEQPTMAATLSRMERDGLLQRKTDPQDKRSTLYSLRTQAKKAVETVAKAVKFNNDEILAVFDEAERKAYLDMMARIVRRLLELEERDDRAMLDR
jgi:MarR family transcriptional regulator for hemolysin